MQKIKYLSESVYRQMEINPFVFYEYVQEECDNDVHDYWLARNDYIKDKCKGDAFDTIEIEAALSIVQLPGKISRQNEYEVIIRPISTKSIKDISALLSCCISQRKAKGSQPLVKDTSYKELLWFLYHCDWSAYLLTKALELLDEDELEIVFHYFNQICFCLTPEKQEKIEKICSQFGFEYTKYTPDYLKESYYILFPKSIFPQTNYDKCWLGLFDIVSAISGDNWFWSNYELSFEQIGMVAPVHYDTRRMIGVNSPLINIARWLNNVDTISTYDDLAWAFWLYSPDYQIKILQRYFYDVMKDNSRFNINLIRTLHKNKYIHLSTFWQYLYEPFEQKENKTITLLDSILRLPYFDTTNSNSINTEDIKCILDIIESPKV